jgi:hypothetical protein
MYSLRSALHRLGWSCLLLASSSWASGLQAVNTAPPVFEKDIAPIFQRSCAPCHVGGNAMGKLQLGSESLILSGAASGSVVTPGDSADSLLIQRILGSNGVPRMPLGGAPLPTADVTMIQRWVDQMKPDQAKSGPAASTDSTLYASKIRPLLAARCYSCHGPSLQQDGLRLDSLAGILKGADTGKVVVPGKSDNSRLVRRLLAQERPMMPYGGPPLSADEISSIKKWIDSGATGPDSTAPLAAAKPVKRWSYIKPIRPAVPTVNNTASVHNPIDNFILAKLAAEGLKPSPEAPKGTLLRRVYLDLTGLPPTPAEVAAFTADQSPNAYEKVVDRLLASPRYGERWARPWLDLARYADSNGYEKDNRRTAWEYRDWVIRALNQDMPFSEFTIDQIAGDMLPNPTKDQLIATGFNRNSMLNQEGGIDIEEYYWLSQVDRVNTTASVWLGATLGCAQCHNHKFDPFPQKDYYRFLAFFNNADHNPAGKSDNYMQEPELPLPSPEQDKESKAIHAKMDQLRAILDTQTAPLDTAQQSWEKQMIAAEATWKPVKTATAESAGGAILTVLPDASILASGKNPQADSYKLTAQTTLSKVTGVRIEVLPDPSLPHNGPGRDAEGNFFLSDFDLQIIGKPVAWKSALSDESQSGYAAKSIVKKKPDQLVGWAIESGDQKAWTRQAVFVPMEPLEIPAGATLSFHIAHQMRHSSRNLGRFRISLTSSDKPKFIVEIPASLRPLLSASADRRTSEQSEKLSTAFRAVAPDLDPVRKQMASLEKDLAKLGIPTAMVMRETASSARPSAFLRERGTYTSPGELVYADVPAAFNPLPKDAPPNRLGLAQWLVSEDNPLTARVAVNHFWETLFGRGLVETSEDFGSQGDLPSHPELLDWLATEFMQNGWSMKKIQKLMVMSAAYRQDSRVTPALAARDPYNRLYAHGPRFRVESEMVHDMVLAESGLLSSKMYGPSVFPYQPDGVWDIPYNDDKWIESQGNDHYRRSVYTFIRRSAPYPSLVTYDATSREFCTVRRVRTNTPLQALTSLNDPFFFDAARSMAKRMSAEAGSSVKEQIDYGYRLAISRSPSETERQRVLNFYNEQLAAYQKDPSAAARTLAMKSSPSRNAPEMAALTMVANVLLNMDESITKE